MAGWVSPLEDVPDPAFAQRMLGDGLAIDPIEGVLRAPCDATVLSVHDAGHAITLSGPERLELLLHVGLDTVELAGAGFTPLVARGQVVTSGQPLIRFDLDAVACRARSLVTPVIIANGERFRIVSRAQPGVIRQGAVLIALEALADHAPDSGDALPVDSHVTRSLVVNLPHGIHARPAARLAAIARQYRAECHVLKGANRASARSMAAMLGLGIAAGETISIAASGPDAEALVEALAQAIASGLDEPAGDPRPIAPAAPVQTGGVAEDGAWIGTLAAPGFALGQAAFLRLAEPELPKAGGGREVEQQRLTQGLAHLSSMLAAPGGHGAGGGIIAAHQALIEDPVLIERANALIAQGCSAAYSWRETCRLQAETMRALSDPRLSERADDLIDLGRQGVAAITGTQEVLPAFAPGTILLARELLPSQIMQLDANVVGIALEQGGPTSHVAILAAGKGIPMLVALGERLGQVAEGETVLIDGARACLKPRLSPDECRAAEAEWQRRQDARAAMLAAAEQPCTSADGQRIEIFANLGSLADAERAVAAGAEGCGLLRTEFLFLERDTAPTVAQQQQAYGAIAAALGGRPLIVRLLDIGGDKPAPYLPIAPEANPALGLRGIRVGLSRPDMLDDQLRAILGVRPAGQCRIMLPMVASASEVEAVRRRADALRQELGIAEPPEIGIMIETPAAAVTAAALAAHVDFFSVGTNDLAQYALAMDRDNPAVASGLDGLHPGVIGLIAHAARGAREQGRWIGVCGGLAADPLAVPILLGLGITELSMPSGLIPEMKHLVRRLPIDGCTRLAEAALRLDSAESIRALSRRFVEELA